jgi:hypothetical protein
MGRPSRPNPYSDPVDTLAPHKLYLSRVAIDSGGYDEGGAYWGLGQPLYWYRNAEGTIDGFLRAPWRGGAKAKLLELYPAATFYR